MSGPERRHPVPGHVRATWHGLWSPGTADGPLPDRTAVADALSAGADPDAVVGDHQRTALHVASGGGGRVDDADRMDLIAALLVAGASPHAEDTTGRAPLHLAAMVAGRAVITALRDAGASPDRPDGQGRTPLHVAAVAGNVDGIAALLDAGIPVDQPAADGRSPLALAIAVGAGHDTLRYLRTRGAMSGGDVVLEALVRAKAGDRTPLRLVLRRPDGAVPGIPDPAALAAGGAKAPLAARIMRMAAASGDPRVAVVAWCMLQDTAEPWAAAIAARHPDPPRPADADDALWMAGIAGAHAGAPWSMRLLAALGRRT